MIVMLSVASLSIVAVQHQVLTAGVDETLRQRADNLEPIDGTTDELPTEGDPEDGFAQILSPTGLLIASTSNVAGAPAFAPRAGSVTGQSVTTSQVPALDGARFRILLRPVDIDGNPGVLVIAKNLDDVTDSVHTLGKILAVVAPILVAMLALLAWWLTGRTLRPVDALRIEVEDIDGSALHRRVPVPGTNDEIADLARTMNDMLERVEQATARQQQFVDDASHELRTPLTRMVTDLEVAIAHPKQEAEHETLGRVLESSLELRKILADLLYLAGISPDRARPHAEVDLDDLALRSAKDLRSRKTVGVDTTGVSAARVLGDSPSLERAMRNLLDNAARHAANAVRISTGSAGGLAWVIVEDDGAGVADQDRQRIFERFIRLDEARSRDDGGTGLGLAIVMEIAVRHHGTVAVDEATIGGARFTMTMPSALEGEPIQPG